MKRPVGRPIEKENRTKVGLSLDGSYVSMLNHMAKSNGKTKSRIIEEAILLMYEQSQLEEKIVPEVPFEKEIQLTDSNISMESPSEVKEDKGLDSETKDVIKESLARLKAKETENESTSLNEQEKRDLERKTAFENIRSIFR